MLNTLLAASGALAIFGLSAAVFVPPADAPTKPAPAPVFVELFTSEGCSSCPPADELVSVLAKTYKDKPVHFAAFHVDYWDSIGWPDRFASPAFTERQHSYASAFKSRSVYTPQLVVGGTVEFVGSNRARAVEAIDAALSKPAPAKLQLTITPPPKADERAKPDQPINLSVKGMWTGPEPTGPKHVLALLVEDGLSSKVTRGENAGRTLKHDSVVRAVAQIDLPASGQASLTLKPPADIDRTKCRVIVVLQSRAANQPGTVYASASEKLP